MPTKLTAEIIDRWGLWKHALRTAWAVVFGLWNIASALFTFRDNFLPLSTQESLRTTRMVAQWDHWHLWIVGSLTIAVVAALEGCFRGHKHHLKEATIAHERQLEIEKGHTADLKCRLLEAQSAVGRPQLSLRFSEAIRREPEFDGKTMISYDRESEFIARNGSEYDAHEVYLNPTTIGAFTIQSRIPIDIAKNHEERIEYTVHYEQQGKSYGNLEYRHNLRPLLNALFEKLPCHETESLTIPFQLAYKDSSGRCFETDFIMSHDPEIPEYPQLSIQHSRRLE